MDIGEVDSVLFQAMLPILSHLLYFFRCYSKQIAHFHAHFWATLNSYSRIYLGVHYPGDILFGTLAGCLIGYLMYLLYSFIYKRIFHQPRCISNKYTASGYLINDINLLFTVLLLTYFMIILLGFITAHTLNL